MMAPRDFDRRFGGTVNFILRGAGGRELDPWAEEPEGCKLVCADNTFCLLLSQVHSDSQIGHMSFSSSSGREDDWVTPTLGVWV